MNTFKEGDLVENVETKAIRVWSRLDADKTDATLFAKSNQTLTEAFKSGTWVQYKANIYKPEQLHIHQVKELTYFEKLGRWYVNGEYIERLETWRPSCGEWCWFGYQGDKIYPPKLNQFREMNEDGGYMALPCLCPRYEPEYFETCEPFLGKLPTQLKAN